jgi:hypothetical protein
VNLIPAMKNGGRPCRHLARWFYQKA